MTARLRHYACGSTRHDLGRLFAGAPHEMREFPAGAFLYDAGERRRVLFDTGYAPTPWRTGLRGVLYRHLLPPRLGEGEDIAAQLRADGVEPASVTHVVLSHLHPDHIGGLGHFSGAELVLGEGLLRTLAAPRLREGLLPGLLPEWFPHAARLVVADAGLRPTTVAGQELRAHDLFGDGRYLLLDLPGHAEGHLGALIEGRVLLAGDAGWGTPLLEAAPRMRALPRAIQDDEGAYLRTASTLRALAEAGVRVICSHDPLRERELLG